MLSGCHFRFLSVFLGVAFLLSGELAAALKRPPVLGEIGPETEPHAHYELVFEENFEGSLEEYFIGPSFEQTSDPASVLEGQRTLKLIGRSSAVQIPASILNLRGEETYLVELEYRTVSPNLQDYAFVAALTWPEFPIDRPGAVSGPLNSVYPAQGTFRTTLRIGATSEALFTLVALDSEVLVDALKIYRLEVRYAAPRPRPIQAGFPRLSNFYVYGSGFGSMVNGTSLSREVATLSLYDFVNGMPYDHTYGENLAFLTLRALNPEIRIVPYVQSYMAVLGASRALAGSAGMLGLFNEGLQEEWYMRDVDGEKLPELLYPQNFQMNHTALGQSVEGVRFVDYQIDYVRHSILGTGLWDGIHFDQSEWLTNSLLGTDSPFTGGEVVLPAIDLDADGNAETEQELGAAWREAFYSFFDTMRLAAGPGPLLFGNSGTVPRDPKVLRRFNGLQNEFFTPYQIDGEGNWLTTGASGWHRFMETSARAARYLQHPQILATQFVGYRLGVPSGEITENGLDGREPTLEARDYRRARFGLATTLLAGGFFGYDYTDNSSSPDIWLDEYAVNAEGVAEKSAAAKGYLGQPLGEAEEITSPFEVVYELNFEPGELLTRPGLYVNENLLITTDPEEVLSGGGSGRLEYTNEGQEGDALVVTEFGSPGSSRLEVGAVYQVLVDYHITEIDENAEGGVLSVGVTDFETVGENVLFETNNIYVSDIDGELRGSLRAAAKVSSADAFASVLVLKDQTVLIDRFRLLKGNGGAYRRDFEGGVVLVNPTPNEVTLSLTEIRGSLQRTGLRRLLGTQDSAWNTGEPLLDELRLPSGEALILLADWVSRRAPEIPADFSVSEVTATSIQWRVLPPDPSPAGYRLNFGILGGDQTSFRLVGTEPTTVLTGLQPGTTYQCSVQSFDYGGNFSPPSSPLTFQTLGANVINRPVLTDLTALLTGGEEVTLQGALPGVSEVSVETAPLPQTLGGVRMYFNGIAAGVRSVGPSELTVEVPSQLTGDRVIVRLESSGVTSPSYWMDRSAEGRQIPSEYETHSAQNATLRWTSEPHRDYWIESSEDLRQWQLLQKVTGVGAQIEQILPVSRAEKKHFYRVTE